MISRACVGAMALAVVTAACGEAPRPETPPAVLVIGQSPPQDAASPAVDSTPAPVAVNGSDSELVDPEPALRLAPGPVTPGCAPFDRGAAAQGLGAVDLKKCQQAGGPTGAGHVKVVFATSGQVQSAAIDGGAFAGTPAGSCIALQFRNARVPPFCGAPVTVGKSFRVP